MARLVVGGVECFVEETQVTLGHVVIPLRDLVAFGIAERARKVVFAYVRRGPELGYRDQPSGKPATVSLQLNGDFESLAVLLRARAREAWRGRHDTVEGVLGEDAPEPPVGLQSAKGSVAITVVLFVVGCAFLLWRSC